jgi:hypothetical protein
MKYDIFAGANEVKYHGTLRFDNFSQAGRSRRKRLNIVVIVNTFKSLQII